MRRPITITSPQQNNRRPSALMILLLMTAAVLTAISLTATIGCTRSPDSPDGLMVVVSIVPQAHFVEKIAGPRVAAMVLVGPQQSPETYQVSPRQIATLGQAQAWFQVGMEFETQLEPRIKSNFPNLQIVRTQQNIRLRAMETEFDAPAAGGHDDDKHDDHADDEECTDHAHHNHAHGAFDPHIWLDPKLVKIQAANIARGLIEVDPEGRQTYQQNLADFQAELDLLDAELRQKLAPVAGKRMLVAHPAFGYFADAYGLRQVSAEVEGKEPTGRQLAALQDLAHEHGVRTIFVQPQFSARVADLLAQRIGGRVVVLDPLAEGDYAANMRLMADAIADALSQEQQAPVNSPVPGSQH